MDSLLSFGHKRIVVFVVRYSFLGILIGIFLGSWTSFSWALASLVWVFVGFFSVLVLGSLINIILFGLKRPQLAYSTVKPHQLVLEWEHPLPRLFPLFSWTMEIFFISSSGKKERLYWRHQAGGISHHQLDWQKVPLARGEYRLEFLLSFSDWAFWASWPVSFFSFEEKLLCFPQTQRAVPFRAFWQDLPKKESQQALWPFLPRPYVLGDNPRRIDWKLLAHHDVLFIRGDEPDDDQETVILEISLPSFQQNKKPSSDEVDELIWASVDLAQRLKKAHYRLAGSWRPDFVKDGQELSFWERYCANMTQEEKYPLSLSGNRLILGFQGMSPPLSGGDVFWEYPLYRNKRLRKWWQRIFFYSSRENPFLERKTAIWLRQA